MNSNLIANKYTFPEVEAIQKEANKKLRAVYMVYFPDRNSPYLSIGAVKSVLEAVEEICPQEERNESS